MGESGPRPRSLAGAVEARDAGPLMPGIAPEPGSPARWPARTAHDSRPRGSVRSRAESCDRPKMVWCFAANRPNREDPGSRLARDLTEPDVFVQPLTSAFRGSAWTAKTAEVGPARSRICSGLAAMACTSQIAWCTAARSELYTL